jgi:hypothetical protein
MPVPMSNANRIGSSKTVTHGRARGATVIVSHEQQKPRRLLPQVICHSGYSAGGHERRHERGHRKNQNHAPQRAARRRRLLLSYQLFLLWSDGFALHLKRDNNRDEAHRTKDRFLSRTLVVEEGEKAEVGLARTLEVMSLFTELPRRGIPGSSLSRGAARGCLRICHEALEDGIGDASLEAPQRLLTRFALRDLLAVVGFAPSVRPGLADGNHVQGVLSLRFPASESLWRTTSPLEASTGAVPE